MKKISMVAILTATAMSVSIGMATSVSEPISVIAFPRHDSRHWMTVRTAAVPLHWEWPATAASAQLKIVGMNRSITEEFASVTTDWIWQVSQSEVPSTEDVFTLTLTFRNGGGGVVGALTSQLAVVTGAFGQTPVDPDPVEKAAWRRVKGNVVIPYDVGWDDAASSATASQLVIAKIDGITEINALSNTTGYFGWKVESKVWGHGTFDLALTFPDTVADGWEATLVRMPTATVINLR